MKITFFSNFLNHHQLPFCKEMLNLIGNNFKFVATEKIPDERIKMGYEDMNSKYEFVVRAYENEKEAFRLGVESDIVIIGSSPKKYVNYRIKNKIGITFAYSERIFRSDGFKTSLKKLYYKYIKEKNQNGNYYLLCSSAFTSEDYNSIGLFNDRTLKWGYFPEVKEYKKIDSLIRNKEKNSIIWVGRFIELKHPEIVINVAKKLKNQKITFSIKMVGTGVLEEKIKDMIKLNDLDKCIAIEGAMTPKEVRKRMEKSRIFVFTSDRREGWGAVLNEAMNSGCAVIASHEIGSVPFLIDDNKNGLIYENGSEEELYNKIRMLLNNNALTEKLGVNAYKTMINLWNPKIAANRIIELSTSLINNKKILDYKNGPCSKAKNIKNDWYLNK